MHYPGQRRVSVWPIVVLLASLLLAGQGFGLRTPARQVDGLLRLSDGLSHPPAPLALVNQPSTFSPPATTGVASATPTVTLTPPPEPTATPPPTAQPQPLPVVHLSLVATPGEVSPGDLISYTLTLTSTGSTPATGLTVTDPLPPGTSYVPGSATAGQYDPATRTLTWPVPELAPGLPITLAFQARVRGDALEDLIVNRAEVTVPGRLRPIRAQATVPVVRRVVILPGGGVLETPSGRLRVVFPPGAVDRPVTAHFVPRSARRLAARQAGMAFTFGLEATNPAGQRVTRFARPLTVTLRVGDLVNWGSRPDFLRPWVAHRDGASGRWVSITPTRLDEQAGVVVFTTDHFSSFGTGSTGVEESGWLLNFNDARVGRFSGALTWGYDFELPPGPGGVRPGLRLSYNSRRLDGVLTWAQSDGTGWGWSLDSVEVLWRHVRREWDGAHYHLVWDAVPLLVLNGEALKLVPETVLPANAQYLGPDGSYRFRTEDDRLWRVQWRPGQVGVDGWNPETDGWDGNGYWEVVLRDGTRYLLGTTPDSRQTLRGWIGDWSGTGWLAGKSTVRWRLKEIVYPTGVTVTHAYAEQTYQDQCDLWVAAGKLDPQNPADSCPNGDDGDSERASYLTEITYPGTRVRLEWDRRWNGNGPDDGFSAVAYRSDYANFGDPTGPKLAIFWQTDALQKAVLERGGVNGTWMPVKEWRFTYGTYIPEDESNKRLRILTQLQVWSPQGNALPAYTFGYQGYRNKQGCSPSCSAWDQAQFYYPRLIRISNGYGGLITAGYETRDGGPGGHKLARNYRVVQRSVEDGQGGGWREVYTYSDGDRGRCYLESEDATGCKWPDQFDGQVTGGTFLGYRAVTETVRVGALGVYTTTYTYDPQDRVVTTTYPDGEVITTTYNAAGWPADLSSSPEAGSVAEMTYNAQGQPKLITYTLAALVTHFGYYGYNGWGLGDPDDAPDQSWANVHVGKLWKLCTVPVGQACPQAGSSSSLLDLRYSYDGVGNIASLRDKTGGGDVLQSFTYDDLDRLVGVSGAYSEGYSYDAIGNLRTKSEGGVSYTLEYTVTRPVHAPSTVNGMAYTYDANGNLETRGGESYAYDAENRLQQVTTATGETVTFTYDADGQRVMRDTITETVVYVGPHYELRFDKTSKRWDLDNDCRGTVVDIMQVAAHWGANPAEPWDMDDDGDVDVYDVQSVAAAWRETCHELVETTKYYHLGGQRVAMRREPVGQADTLYYLFADHLGSTSVTYNTATGQIQTLRYYPWGSVRSGNVPTDRRFTGQRWDDTIGLYDYNARWYDPMLGRFVQPDPIVPNPANPQALNRYNYDLNNPLRYTDRSGHVPIDWIIDVVGVGYDIYQLVREPSWENARNLVVDVGLWALPYTPAVAGVATKGGKVATMAARVEELLRLGRTVGWAERFAGASPEVLRGVERLAKLVENERVPAKFRRGFAAELLRAEEYFKAGKLRAVEAVIEGGRVDLVLVTDEIVEVKYWRESYAAEHVKQLVEQLQRYQAPGRQLKLEFVRTSTDPITDEFLKRLYLTLQAKGIDISSLTIEIVK